MSGPNRGLMKAYVAEAAIARRRIVKHGTADGKMLQADSSTVAIAGVSHELDTAIGGRVDVQLEGLAEVEYGGNVTRGDPVTADANGKAIAAAPASGVNARIVGFAMVSGVSGDIGTVHINLGRIQG